MALPPPTVGEVDAIVGTGDRILRNLQITQAYHDISAALAQRVPGRANWCTFAVWASKQAGQTIRQEDLRRVFERRLGGHPATARAIDRLLRLLTKVRASDPTDLRSLLLRVLRPDDAFEQASEAVARGNTMVFAEIGREMARFLEGFGASQSFREEELEEFCSALLPGSAPDGQDALRGAFRSLLRSFFEANRALRAQRLHLSSILIGVHEQTRLQPEIARALDAPVADGRLTRRRLFHELFPRFPPLRWLMERYLRLTTPLDEVWAAVADRVRERAREAITEVLMSLEVPGEVLCLGEDLEREMPDDLRRLTLPEFAPVLATVDPTPDSTAGSGARDWADFPDRMHYIADFFRSFQDEARLQERPFSPGQEAAIRAGRKPEGPL
jgi:hypothetical protein